MPYKSEAQRRYFHWAQEQGLIKKEDVEKWDKESEGKKLPERLTMDKKALYKTALPSIDKAPEMLEEILSKLKSGAGGLYQDTKNLPDNVGKLHSYYKGQLPAGDEEELLKNYLSSAIKNPSESVGLEEVAKQMALENAKATGRGLVIPAAAGAGAYELSKDSALSGVTPDDAFRAGFMSKLAFGEASLGQMPLESEHPGMFGALGAGLGAGGAYAATHGRPGLGAGLGAAGAGLMGMGLSGYRGGEQMKLQQLVTQIITAIQQQDRNTLQQLSQDPMFEQALQMLEQQEGGGQEQQMGQEMGQQEEMPQE